VWKKAKNGSPRSRAAFHCCVCWSCVFAEISRFDNAPAIQARRTDVGIERHEDLRGVREGVPLERVALHTLHESLRVGLGCVERIGQQISQSHVRLRRLGTRCARIGPIHAKALPRSRHNENIRAPEAAIGSESA
jgi:hypothetical protein